MALYDISKLSAADKLLRAKIQMYKQSPFFSYILLHMKPTKDDKIRTMAVDVHGNLYWNEAFVNGLTQEQLVGVLAHEACHIALMHLERSRGKSQQVFNLTNDLAVNNILHNEGYQLPKCGLIPDNNKYEFKEFDCTIDKIHEKSSESMYDELYPHIPTHIGGGASGGQGKKLPEGFDEHRYGSDKGDEEGDKDQQGATKRQGEWKKIIAEAAQLAKQQGKLPAGFERMIDEILDSKVNWKHKLYKYIVDTIIHDYSWKMPSKRTASLGIYTPRPIRESVQIVVSIDTSGSISKDDLQSFLSEMVNIVQSFPNVNIDVIICDAEVHETYELTGDSVDDILSMKMSGGGGTSHRPIYNYVEEHIQDAKVVINFTDGYTDFPKNPDELPFDSLWVISKGGVPSENIPFGEVIRIE